MLTALREDVESVLQRDPAARHWLHVILFYPGLHAIWLHRIAHRLWNMNWHFGAHAIATFARWLTGIEIHPAAKLGRRLFIDHGMGVVIGETAEVGDDVTIYHGVTLGGVSLSRGKRHPTLEDHVVVGAGAKVLGAITVGQHSRIGANAVVVKNVDSEQIVVGVPGRVVTRRGASAPIDLQHDQLPDVLSERLDAMITRLARIESLLHDEDEAFEVDGDYVI